MAFTAKQKRFEDLALAGSRVEMRIHLDDGTTLQASMEVAPIDLSNWRARQGVDVNIGSRLLSMCGEDFRDRVRSGSLEPNTQ